MWNETRDMPRLAIEVEQIEMTREELLEEVTRLSNLVDMLQNLRHSQNEIILELEEALEVATEGEQ